MTSNLASWWALCSMVEAIALLVIFEDEIRVMDGTERAWAAFLSLVAGVLTPPLVIVAIAAVAFAICTFAIMAATWLIGWCLSALFGPLLRAASGDRK